jgi:molecular chaperone DnaK
MRTGREQSIKITASSGLTEEEIKRLVKDAEVHGEGERKKRAVAEAMYSSASQQQQARAKATGIYDRPGSSNDEDVVDANFHEF